MSACQMNGSSQNRRVLAVQSHVVHGYVGNKSATFPLQVSATRVHINAIVLRFTFHKPQTITFYMIF